MSETELRRSVSRDKLRWCEGRRAHASGGASRARRRRGAGLLAERADATRATTGTRNGGAFSSRPAARASFTSSSAVVWRSASKALAPPDPGPTARIAARPTATIAAPPLRARASAASSRGGHRRASSSSSARRATATRWASRRRTPRRPRRRRRTARRVGRRGRRRPSSRAHAAKNASISLECFRGRVDHGDGQSAAAKGDAAPPGRPEARGGPSSRPAGNARRPRLSVRAIVTESEATSVARTTGPGPRGGGDSIAHRPGARQE